MTQKQSVQIRISGRVQNVGFRYHTYQKATELGIVGFVKNMPDGSVYIEAEALEENLNEFVIWCHQGPDWARILEVKVTEQPLGNYPEFSINR